MQKEKASYQNTLNSVGRWLQEVSETSCGFPSKDQELESPYSLGGSGRDAKTGIEGLFERLSLGLPGHHLLQSVDCPPLSVCLFASLSPSQSHTNKTYGRLENICREIELQDLQTFSLKTEKKIASGLRQKTDFGWSFCAEIERPKT